MSDITQLEEVSDIEKFSDEEIFERQPTSYKWRGIAGYYGSRAL